MLPTNANDPLRTADYKPSVAPLPPDIISDFPQSSAVVGDTRTHAPGHDAAPMPAVPERTPGSASVPGYEIECVLGRGGMGVVYKARQIGLNRLVALKMILGGGHAAVGERTRFLAEAQAVAQLEHPNLIRLYEVGQHEGLPYFTMEFVAGGTLARKLNGTPLPAKEGARLLLQLAQGMHYAHQRGIVHRDLKPGNVLLQISDCEDTASSKPGESAKGGLQSVIAKITDFGLARRVETGSGVTATGAVLGTPSYMAPEQAEGKGKEAGPAADVYALGAILYECLTGRPPFRGPTPVDTILQVIADEPVPPSRLNRHVPRDIETICLKCLQKESHRRYACAAELADDLNRFLAGEPVHARPTSIWERARKWAARRPALAAAGSIAGLAILVTLVTLVIAVIRISEAEAEARARELEAQQSAAEKDGLAAKNAGLAQEDRRLRKKSERDAAQLLFEHAHLRCVQDGADRGIHWLARALQKAEDAEDEVLAMSSRRHLASWSRQVHPLKAVLEHTFWVEGMLFSRDGKSLLTRSGKMVRLWNLTSRETVVPPLEHASSVRALAWNPDDGLIVTGCTDGSVRLWDAKSGNQVATLSGHRAAITKACFSPDGSLILTASEDQTARLWIVENGKSLGSPLRHKGIVRACAFSPDGRLAATGSADRTVTLIDTRTGRSVGLSLLHPAQVVLAAFAPDGRELLAGCDDGTIHIWDVSTGKAAALPLSTEKNAKLLDFSSDGQRVLVGAGNTARIWNVRTRLPVDRSLDHFGSIYAGAFSPDNKRALTASLDATARLWDSETGQSIGAPVRHLLMVECVAFSPDGKSFATGSEDFTARIWETATGGRVGPALVHPDSVEGLAFCPRDGKVITFCRDRMIRLWDSSSGSLVRTPWRNAASLRHAAFSPDGQRVLAFSPFDKAAFIWDWNAPNPDVQSLQHDLPLLAGMFGPEGKTVLTRSWTRLWQWDLATRQPSHPQGKPERFKGTAFSPDGRTVLGWDLRDAYLRDVATDRPLDVSFKHTHDVMTASFSHDGKLLVTGTKNGVVQLWETATGKMVGFPLRHPAFIFQAFVSPDKTVLLTRCGDGSIHLWEAITGKALGPPLTHPGRTTCAAFSPDSSSIATGGMDHAAVFWKFPGPMAGAVNRVAVWAQLLTGFQLEGNGEGQVLTARAWREQLRILTQMGGPPEN